ERGEITFFDALAGSGVRGMRVMKEGGQIGEAGINGIFVDLEEEAVEAIKNSLERNNLEGVVIQGDVLKLFGEVRADFLDIDPYGSPAQFLPEALRSVKHGGILAITATDTAPLSGTYPSTCLRRYMAWSHKVDFHKESALRILLGYAIRIAASREIALTPLLSYYRDHYLRAFFRVERSRSRARELLRNVAHLLLKRGTLIRRVVWIYRGGWETPRDFILLGPMWMAETSRISILKRLSPLAEMGGYEEALTLLNALKDEVGYPPWYFEVNEVARLLYREPLSMEKVRSRIEEEGFRFARTHYSKSAFKTDAPPDFLGRILYGVER
ncbi:MAG: hypothetical protein J7L88_04635, partial [Thermoplasmata archaeon]|nr:hypothetical protein [Thermoplasmata archaeon]